MRVTITGGLGFLGSFTAEAYRDAGHRVTLIDDLSANVVTEVPGCETIVADAGGRTVALTKPDVVVHAASPVGAVAVVNQSGRIASEILRTTRAVADSCVEAGALLVNVSTSEVYGFSGVYSEADDLRVPTKRNARLEYAVGKLAAEFAVAGTKDLNAVSIRPFNLAGPRQTKAKGFVVPTFIEQALAMQPLTIFGDGLQERNFTAVHDAAAFITGLLPEHFDGRVVNVGNPSNRTTILALAYQVCDQIGIAPDFEFTSGQAVHGAGYAEAEGRVKVADITLARSMGWEPTVTLEQLVTRSITDSLARSAHA